MSTLTLKHKRKPKKDSKVASEEGGVPVGNSPELDTIEQNSVLDDSVAVEDKPKNTAPETISESLNAPETEPENAQESIVVELEPANAECQTPKWCLPNQKWEGIYEAVPGLSHRDARPPLPCQDAAIVSDGSRPWVIVADGAGSSAVSEIGSQAVVTGLNRLAHTLQKQLASLLDEPAAPSEEAVRTQGLLFVKHARGILDDLSVQHRRPQKDFRCTLLMAIHGKEHLLWLKIGDGALVIEALQKNENSLQPSLNTLGVVGKGEFANQTTFIDDHLQPSDVQVGLYPAQNLTGFAAMSDGAADRLVANDGIQVSSQISGWLHDLRQGKLKRRALTRLLYSDSFTQGTTGDDASIALASSGLVEEL